MTNLNMYWAWVMEKPWKSSWFMMGKLCIKCANTLEEMYIKLKNKNEYFWRPAMKLYIYCMLESIVKLSTASKNSSYVYLKILAVEGHKIIINIYCLWEFLIEQNYILREVINGFHYILFIITLDTMTVLFANNNIY